MLVALGAAPGCGAPPRAMDAAHAATVEAEARRALASVASDLARDGPLGWLAHASRDGFTMASDGAPKFASWAALAEAMRAFAPGVVSMELAWHDVDVDVLSHDLAAFGAAYDETIVTTDEGTLRFSGYATGVLARTREGWRLRRLHWSRPVPP